MTERLYLVTRRDLSPGAQLVQCCHAFREFVARHGATEKTWYVRSNTLAVLAVEDEKALERLMQSALYKGVACANFFEPDMDFSLTAIALEPRGKSLVRSIPLALSHVG